MAKEFFAHDETRPLFKTIEEVAHRSGVSRGQAFEDVLKACVAALAGETMEPEYLEAVKAHTAGLKGKRGVDLFPVFLGQLVHGMNESGADLLGDLFQGAISYGENGLYLTPEAVARLMAQLTIDTVEQPERQSPPTICDPCYGSGILLIEAGKLSPTAELIGTDVDARCARITAINLGLRAKYGWVICGNSLTQDVQFAYRIGSFFHEGPNGLRRGVIRQVPADRCSVLPEIAGTTGDLLATLREPNPVSHADAFPKIIEVPPWALRLEAMQSIENAARAPVEETLEPAAPPEHKAEHPDTSHPGAVVQRWLFE